jgi:hypothetical protein
MASPTVYAVMKVTIEIPVRPSQVGETIEELYRVSKLEAEGILRNKLPDNFRIAGDVVFSHAVVKVT